MAVCLKNMFDCCQEPTLVTEFVGRHSQNHAHDHGAITGRVADCEVRGRVWGNLEGVRGGYTFSSVLLNFSTDSVAT